ncbi:hypothetical protein MKW98_020938 [Papaver atlanticum]|uniref:Secreted protein n=1 Tax=Papaver atlanticum TaxID=357466 RepID=A0AAD4XS97_9MAGN|nr:hypothetical protein MKW98_020938 [Papaver atlanticum]
MHYCCMWLLPSLIMSADTTNLKWVDKVAGQSLAVIVKSHFVPIFGVCIEIFLVPHLLKSCVCFRSSRYSRSASPARRCSPSPSPADQIRCKSQIDLQLAGY